MQAWETKTKKLLRQIKFGRRQGWFLPWLQKYFAKQPLQRVTMMNVDLMQKCGQQTLDNFLKVFL